MILLSVCRLRPVSFSPLPGSELNMGHKHATEGVCKEFPSSFSGALCYRSSMSPRKKRDPSFSLLRALRTVNSHIQRGSGL